MGVGVFAAAAVCLLVAGMVLLPSEPWEGASSAVDRALNYGTSVADSADGALAAIRAVNMTLPQIERIIAEELKASATRADLMVWWLLGVCAA